jgi:hypothetical protein
MKMETFENWLLLEQSGELDALRGWLLRRELARNPDLRVLRDELKLVSRAVSNTRVDGPGKEVMDAIRREARQASGRSEQIDWVPARGLSWKPVFATCAAVALVALFAWPALRSTHEPGPVTATQQQATETRDDDLAWDDGVDSDLEALSAMVAQTTDTDVDTLATELLELEGTEI